MLIFMISWKLLSDLVSTLNTVKTFWTVSRRILLVKLQLLEVRERKEGKTFQKLSKWNSHSIIIYQSLIDKLLLLNERICLQSFNVAFLNRIPFVTVFSLSLSLSSLTRQNSKNSLIHSLPKVFDFSKSFMQ